MESCRAREYTHIELGPSVAMPNSWLTADPECMICAVSRLTPGKRPLATSTITWNSPFRLVKNCVPIFLRGSFYSDSHHFPLRPLTPRESPALPWRRESPSHPPGAKDHVSGILDSSAERSSGEVVAENWNSVPHGRWSLPDRRACEMSAQRLVSVVCHSQQASRVNAAMRGPSKEA